MIIAILGLTARIVWTAAASETGLSLLAYQWRQATLGWFVNQDPVSTRTGDEQVEFWLAESDRVLAAAVDEDAHAQATLAMGAAFNLARLRQITLEGEHGEFVLANVPRWFPASARASILGEELKAALQRRIQDLAQRAVELEPENPQWGPLAPTVLTNSIPPQLPLALLRESAQADADNTWFDFAIAQTLLSQGASWKTTNSGGKAIIVPDIQDESALSEGLALLDRAIDKTQSEQSAFHPPLHADQAWLAFRQASSLPEFQRTAGWEMVRDRPWTLGQSIRVQLVALAGTEQVAGNWRKAFELQAKNLLVEQITLADAPYGANTQFCWLRLAADAVDLHTMMLAHPQEFSAEEMLQVQNAATAAAEEWARREWVQETYDARFDPGGLLQNKSQWNSQDVRWMLAGDAPRLLALLLAVLLIAAALRLVISRSGRRHRAATQPQPGEALEPRLLSGKETTVTHVLIWLVAAGGSWMVFGVLPAYGDSLRSSDAFAWAALLLPLFCISGLIWFLVRRGSRKYSLRWLLVILAVAPIVLTAIIRMSTVWFDGVLVEYWQFPAVYMRGLGQRTPPDFLAPGSSWLNFAAVQWMLKAGPAWMVACWLGLSGTIYLAMQWGRSKSKPAQDAATRGGSWRGTLRELCVFWIRGATVIALIVLLFLNWELPALFREHDRLLQLVTRELNEDDIRDFRLQAISDELAADKSAQAAVSVNAAKKVARFQQSGNSPMDSRPN